MPSINEFKKIFKNEDLDSNLNISIKINFSASDAPLPKKDTTKAPQSSPRISTEQEIIKYLEPLK